MEKEQSIRELKQLVSDLEIERDRLKKELKELKKAIVKGALCQK